MAELEYSILYNEEQIKARVREVAAQIKSDIDLSNTVMIAVMKGAVVFATDLLRELSPEVEVEFIGVSSYEGTKSTGTVRITHDLAADIQDKNVLLVEDIIDTGRTIDYLLDVLKVRNPKTIKVCSLLIKPEVYNMKHEIDYTCFEISKEFVIGYGLDLDQKYRGLPYIAQVSNSI